MITQSNQWLIIPTHPLGGGRLPAAHRATQIELAAQWGCEQGDWSRHVRLS